MELRALCTCEATGRRIDVLGVPIDVVSAPEAIARLDAMLGCANSHVVHHVSVDPLVLSARDEDLRAALRRADLNLPDGIGVALGARFLGGPSDVERVPGADLMVEYMKHAAPRGVRHGLMGGSDQLLASLAANLAAQAPGVEIAASYAPPFRAVTPDGVAEDLAGLGRTVDVLWVGIGTPKQQIWADLARAHAPARAIVTVGAAFDFLSGTKRRAPAWVQRANLEWAHRLASEPRRLWRRYLIGNTTYAFRLMGERMKRGRA